MIPKAPMEERINERSAQLIADFREHVAECAAYGGPELVNVDERLIFEGWAIQKIAALQVFVAELQDRLVATDSRLTADTDSRQRPDRTRLVKSRPNLAQAQKRPLPAFPKGKR